MYDWKIKRHPPKNDFSRCCGFSFRKSYASGLAMCGSHTSLRSSVSSHPASPLFLGLKKLISIPNRGKQPSLEKRLRAPRKRSSVSAFRERAVLNSTSQDRYYFFRRLITSSVIFSTLLFASAARIVYGSSNTTSIFFSTRTASIAL